MISRTEVVHSDYEQDFTRRIRALEAQKGRYAMHIALFKHECQNDIYVRDQCEHIRGQESVFGLDSLARYANALGIPSNM